MAEIEFELFNNQLVQQLVGPQDGNLKIIEKALGAEIAAFGNRIRISGDEEAVRQAKNAVDALYSKVSRGIAVGEQEVLAAVRISGAEANVKPQVNIDDIVLKTKKRHIYPRSATQAEYIVEMMNNELVFGLGPAGTGKTFLAVALADVAAVARNKTHRKKIEMIFVVRLECQLPLLEMHIQHFFAHSLCGTHPKLSVLPLKIIRFFRLILRNQSR